MTCSLSIEAPPQNEFDNPLVERNPKRLARWVNQLPLLNLGASIKELHGALEPCNRQRMPEKPRMRLLEVFYPGVAHVFSAAEESYLRSLPLNNSQRQSIKEQITGLCQTLAAGYKILVRDTLSAGVPPRRSPVLLPAIYRAMDLSAMTLLHRYRIYQAVPAGVFRDLHQLYAFAEGHGALDAPIRFERTAIADSSIGHLFRRTMLLACSDPFHFSAGTAVKLYEQLDGYADECRIHLESTANQSGCFLIDLAADTPPRACTKPGSAATARDPRILDARPVVARVKRRLETLTQKSHAREAELEEARVLGVLPGLGKIRRRRSERAPVQLAAHVSPGIAATHFFLAEGASHLQALVGDSGNGIALHDGDPESERHRLMTWRVVNESVDGYLLSAAPGTEVEVGQLLGICVPRSVNEQPRMSLAVVRWMRDAPEQRLEVGVELLAGAPAPVTLTIASGSSREPLSYRGLFLPSVPALDIAPSLVSERQLYAPHCLIEVQGLDGLVRVRAGKSLLDTPHFNRFEFANLGAADNG